ncbi:outer membrane channel protein TolC [Saccharobesus litoralis]|uniref:Outer membrane channel protein TolC n=1 Tax=Saccharobesus litoralis TaxID=2172099 RepID=A0A2S0VVI3_9ALTE|nr:outer membrane channel protein TolC [Saccharobesus litoralis]AWB68182.1 outer membrane channel protein TolC [Saccharobesus litoralis]
MKKALLSAIAIALTGMSTQMNAASLIDIYNQAVENDPLIQEAKANYQSTVQDLDISRGTLLPTIDATISYGDDKRRDVKSTSALVSLQQEIYKHDSWLSLSQTEKSIKQAELVYQAEEQGLIIRTVEAYLNILKAKDDLEFIKAEKQAIERQLEQTKQRFAVGLTAITDVHEAQAQFDNAIAQEISAENNVEFAAENLRAITGVYTLDIASLNTEQFSTSSPNPATSAGWIKRAEQASKNLLAQKIAKDIAQKNIDIANAGHLPSASFNADYGKTENEFGAATEEYTGASWGVRVSVPLYSGGKTSASVRKARHAYVAASQRLELSYRTTQRDVRNSFNNVKASISRIKALQQTVVSAESALKATEAGFEVGTRTIVDVLNSTRNVFDAKRNLSNARYNYILAMLALKQAAGTLEKADVIDLNRGLSHNS